VPEAPLEELLRSLPSVDEVLRSPAGAEWLARYPRALVVDEIRGALAAGRQAIREGRANGAAGLVRRVSESLSRWEAPSLRAVINATGVILHTNLGRAPLAAPAIEAIAATAGRYSNLEYDLATGRRGKRDIHAAVLLERLLGAPAIVVNNNAAAIFLILHELAAGGEAIVSRGELIEIGDGFRIPEIIARSGTRLREVGTTNRTRLDDYRAAIGDAARVLLRVHPSNFRIAGFTERPALRDLAALAHEAGLPLVEDLGSGCLAGLLPEGIDEPPVEASLRSGAGLVCFSGDKLLGGPQAGIVAGRPELISRLRRNPMFRALRAGKLDYAALGATLREYLLGREDRIPALRMIRMPVADIRRRAEALAARLPGNAAVEPGESLLGGGSTPAQSLPGYLLAVEPAGSSAAAIERRLRLGDPPVIVRIERERLLLDLRTVFADQEDALAERLREALES
jgi:L-seryl-tRNA(Ser) seleniumtransferase